VKFKDVLYLIAPFFDPTIKNEWIDGECHHLKDNERETLKQRIQSMILEELILIEQSKAPVAPIDGYRSSFSSTPS
jgi:hypothetical protein